MTRTQQTLIDALKNGQWTSVKALQKVPAVKSLNKTDQQITRAMNGLQSFKGLESKNITSGKSYRLQVITKPENVIEIPEPDAPVKKHPALHKPKAQEESSASQE